MNPEEPAQFGVLGKSRPSIQAVATARGPLSFARLRRAVDHGSAQSGLPAVAPGRIGDALIGGRQLPMICEHFAGALGAAGWPDGACLFLSGRHAAGTRPGEEESTVPQALPQACFCSRAAIAAVPHFIAVCGADKAARAAAAFPNSLASCVCCGPTSTLEAPKRALHQQPIQMR